MMQRNCVESFSLIYDNILSNNRQSEDVHVRLVTKPKFFYLLSHAQPKIKEKSQKKTRSTLFTANQNLHLKSNCRLQLILESSLRVLDRESLFLSTE